MITDDGALQLLKRFMFDGPTLAKVKLAQNNPGAADHLLVLADLTEATFAGYAAILTSTLPVPTLNGSLEAESDSPTLTWTASGAGLQTCFLAYVTFIDATATERLYAVGRFSPPQSVVSIGDTINCKFNFFAFNGTP